MLRRPWGWERPVRLGPSDMPEIQAVLCLHNAAAGSCPLPQKLQEKFATVKLHYQHTGRKHIPDYKHLAFRD